MLRGLYFPALRPRPGWLEALRGMPARLVGYRFVAEEAGPANLGGWESRLVAPLGQDEARFSALLKEMTGREAEFIRGRMLAAQPGSKLDRDEASVAKLSGALQRRAKGGTEAQPEENWVERLWQARLFLKLAEVVTDAEVEVYQGLAAVARRQAEMLQALHGDDDDDEPAAFPVVVPPGPLPGKTFRTEDLLAAWGALYLQDSEPEAFLVTDDPEAAALLVEAVEQRVPGRIIFLPEVSLGEEADRSLLLAALGDILAGKIEEGGAALAALASSRNGGAATGGGALQLKLQLLPGPEFRQAVAGLSGLADELGATALTSPYVLIGTTAPAGLYL